MSPLRVIAALLFCTAAFADDVGVTRVDLRESPEGTTVLFAQVPVRLVSVIGAPVLRDGPAFRSEGLAPAPFGGSALRFVLDRPLAPKDVIELPWRRQGVMVWYRGRDGAAERRLVLREGTGLAIDMAVLRPSAVSFWQRVRTELIDGGRRFLRGFLHVAFLLAIAVAGVGRRALGWSGSFLVGQILGWSATAPAGLRLPVPSGDLALGLATACIGAAVVGRGAGRTVPLLVFFAGALHAAGQDGGLPAILGQDLVLLGAAGLVALVVRRPRRGMRARTGVAVLSGAGSLALVILWLAGSPHAPRWDSSLVPAGAGPVEPLPGPAETGAVPSPSAPSPTPPVPDLPQQAFLVVEPYVVRLEMLVRARDLPAMSDRSEIAVAEQPAVQKAITDRLRGLTRLRIDGVVAPPASERIDFVELTPRGILPRASAQPEPVADAWLGLVWTFDATAMPQRVELRWEGEGALPVTVTDPERSGPADEGATIRWENRLTVDPLPRVVAVPLVPRTMPLPMLALPLLAFALFGRWGGIVRVRVSLTAALLVAPVVEWNVPVPFASATTPSTDRAEFVVRELLSNTYRAFEFRREEAVYDRLATSVAGEQLAQIYLQQRQALEIEERGGARARMETVNVETMRRLSPVDGGFRVECVWTVAGSVSHFGHRHYRQNRYVARVVVRADGGSWKIVSLDVLDEKRVL